MEIGTFEDIPFPGHAFRLVDLQQKLAAATGNSYKLTRFPWWLMAVLSPFWELARELREMRYLYSMSHTLSGEKLARLLPDFEMSPLDMVMRAGLARDIDPDKAMGTGGKAVSA
jgi:hypothetical protein